MRSSGSWSTAATYTWLSRPCSSRRGWRCTPISNAGSSPSGVVMPKKSDDAQRAELLVQAGLSPQYVADVLGVAIESKTMISSRSLTKPDAELATKLRGLIDYAIDEAAWEIQWGAPNARIGLLKVLVSRGSQLL